MRVLGIDLGSNFFGFVCVEVRGNSFFWIGYEVVNVSEWKDKFLEVCLCVIHEGVQIVLDFWKFEVVVVEEVFFVKNLKSAIKFGQVRGVVFLGAVVCGLLIFEYFVILVK